MSLNLQDIFKPWLKPICTTFHEICTPWFCFFLLCFVSSLFPSAGKVKNVVNRQHLATTTKTSTYMLLDSFILHRLSTLATNSTYPYILTHFSRTMQHFTTHICINICLKTQEYNTSTKIILVNTAPMFCTIFLWCFKITMLNFLLFQESFVCPWVSMWQGWYISIC